MQMEPIINQPLIETDRFDLRPLRRSDQGLIELYTSDERVAKNTTSIPHPLPPGRTEAFVTRAMSDSQDEDIWAIDGTKSNGAEVMGLISLTMLDRNQSEISYWVAPTFWNTHIGSDAVTALVQENLLANDAIFASVFQDNPASAKVLTNAGFVYLGDAETYCVARDAAVPTWTYSRKF